MGVGMEGVVTMSSLEGGLRDPSALTATTCIKAMGLQHAKYHVQAAPAGPQLQKMDSTAQHCTAQRSTARRTSIPLQTRLYYVAGLSIEAAEGAGGGGAGDNHAAPRGASDRAQCEPVALPGATNWRPDDSGGCGWAERPAGHCRGAANSE